MDEDAQARNTPEEAELVDHLILWAPLFDAGRPGLFIRKEPTTGLDGRITCGWTAMTEPFWDFVDAAKPLLAWKNTQTPSPDTERRLATGGRPDTIDRLDGADLTYLATVLGQALRAERFSEGLLADLVEGGWFRAWFTALERLRTQHLPRAQATSRQVDV